MTRTEAIIMGALALWAILSLILGLAIGPILSRRSHDHAAAREEQPGTCLVCTAECTCDSDCRSLWCRSWIRSI